MQKKTVLIVLVVLLLLPIRPALAAFYRWVDADGREFFTNDANQIPPEYRNAATAVEPDASRVSVQEQPAGRSRRTVAPAEHRDRYGRGEAYWRKKATNLRLKLRDQQDDYDAVVRRLEDLVSRPGRKKTRSTLEKKKKKLERDMARTRRMLEVDLPEEARKADAYPGWIRE